MAFQNAEAIQKLYVAFFNRPADYYGLQYWDSVVTAAKGNTAAVAAEFSKSKEYTDTFAGMNTRQVINTVYKNLFGRSADEAGLEYWFGEVNAGRVTIANAVTSIAAGAQNADKTAFESKVTAAGAFTNALDTTDERLGYAGEKANAIAKQFIAGVTDAATLAAAIAPANLDVTINTSIGAGQVAQTFQLTKGLDNIVGTAGNDLIVGSIDVGGNAELNTLSSIDIIDGGVGIDTLKIQHANGAINLGSLSNVEIVQIDSAATAGVVVDSTTATGVTQLSILKAAGAVDVTAGAATDISLAAREGGTGALAHAVDGGKNVTVTATEMGNAVLANADTITVGADVAAKGNVVVNVVGKAYDAAGGDVFMGNVSVKGGTSITVNQTAAVNATGVGADTTAGTVNLGDITATTDAATTTVTVKQTATVAAKNGVAADVGGVTETATVKFNALKNGDVIVLNGLTFTAKADMTAAEVAAAFSNLVKNTLPATGDTQSSGVYTKGTYSGLFNTAAWTSGAAAGDTVVFTSATKNTDVTNLNDATLFTFTAAGTNGTTAPAFTLVQGAAVTATGAVSGGVMGVDAGVVTVAAATADALKTVTVDGYSATGSAMTGTASSKLDTVNLLNGGDFVIGAAAETLALNLTNVVRTAAVGTTPAVAAGVDINATATKTLNVTTNGANFADLDLAGASAAANLNVSGNGVLTATGSALGTVKAIKVSGSAGLDLGTTARDVTSVDTTGTTGTVTIAINGTSTYAGGAGKDIVTVANANVAIGKSIDLGAGDDTLDLTNAGTILVPTVDLKGGEGRDTLKMSAANAVALSAAATFGGKIEGFEVLSLDKATAAGTVNLSNLDNINYVVSQNSDSVTGTATRATFSVTIANGATAGDIVSFNGTDVFTAGGTLTAAELTAQLAGRTFAGWTVTGFSGTTLNFASTATGAAAVAPVSTANPFAFNDADTSGSAATFTLGSQVNGADAAPAAAALTLGNLASGGTLELTAGGSGVIVNVKDAATGTADVLNIVAKATGLGTVTANNVETVNVEAAANSTMTVAGNSSLTAINVTGAKDLGLTLGGNNVAAVNASAATGALTLNLSAHNGVAVTVTGGAGNDVLTASAGTNAKADVLVGGAGTDTLVAGSNGARLTGGAGNDLFVLSTGTKEANTYSIITDFAAGDLLQLKAAGNVNVTSFTKLSASLNESTSVFSNFVDAAIAQGGAGDGQAVWFTFGGNSYVVIDNAGTATTFDNGVDSIIQLAGIATLDNASFNTTYGTLGLI